MTIIETSRGTTHRAKWAHEAHNPDLVLIEIEDERPLSEIAAEFEGLETVTRIIPNGERNVYAGYSKLVTISKESRVGTALLTLAKP